MKLSRIILDSRKTFPQSLKKQPQIASNPFHRQQSNQIPYSERHSESGLHFYQISTRQKTKKKKNYTFFPAGMLWGAGPRHFHLNRKRDQMKRDTRQNSFGGLESELKHSRYDIL